MNPPREAQGCEPGNRLWDDLSRINNELLKLQRDLARKSHELEEALTEIKTLQGIIPICSQCKKVRDDKDSWTQLKAYIHQHTDARFSHALCPECAEAYLAGLRKAPSS